MCNKPENTSWDSYCQSNQSNCSYCKIRTLSPSPLVVVRGGVTPSSGLQRQIFSMLNILEENNINLEEAINYSIQLRDEGKINQANILHQSINYKLAEDFRYNNLMEFNIYKRNIEEQVLTLKKTRKYSELENTKNLLNILNSIPRE